MHAHLQHDEEAVVAGGVALSKDGLPRLEVHRSAMGNHSVEVLGAKSEEGIDGGEDVARVHAAHLTRKRLWKLRRLSAN